MAEADYLELQPSLASPLKGQHPNKTYDVSCVVDNDTFMVTEDGLMKFPASANVTFVVMYLLMLGIAVVANSLTICVTYKGKHRLLYRCCLISLACSDLMIAVAFGLSNFPKFLQDFHNSWVMGEFLCYFLPFMQTMSVLANSMTLSCIAVDRYLVVTQVTRTYWNPSGFVCFACIATIWVTSAGVAVPMYGHYIWLTAAMIGDVDKPCYILHMCSLVTKEVKNRYFIAVFTIIFLPLLCTFVVLYCLVMRFLWTRKRPGASKPFIAPLAGGGADAKGVCSTAAAARDSRKTRTVKAILALMVTFVCLRMPSWVFLLYVSGPERNLTGLGWWLAQNVCSALVVLNSAVNPFFYCFLAQVMSAWDWLSARCCSTSGKIPPTHEMAMAATEGGKCPSPQRSKMMIPRGPYSVLEPSGEANQQLRIDGQNDSCMTMSSSLNSLPRFKGKELYCSPDPSIHPTV